MHQRLQPTFGSIMSKFLHLASSKWQIIDDNAGDLCTSLRLIRMIHSNHVSYLWRRTEMSCKSYRNWAHEKVLYRCLCSCCHFLLVVFIIHRWESFLAAISLHGLGRHFGTQTNKRSDDCRICLDIRLMTDHCNCLCMYMLMLAYVWVQFRFWIKWNLYLIVECTELSFL